MNISHLVAIIGKMPISMLGLVFRRELLISRLLDVGPII
jgi:hypothetical protein